MCRKRKHTLVESLNDLSDIAHSSALSMIKIEEDKEFLLLRRQKDRRGCMIGAGLNLTKTEQLKYNQEKKNTNKEKKPNVCQNLK